jgi:Tfp pilus assembly protein PilV
MRRIVLQNKNNGSEGVTLVEVMISLVILLIVFMGLIQASLLSMQSNMKNVLRDEAVRITADQMSILRSAPFDDMNKDTVADTYPLNFTADRTINVRNVANHPFGVAINVITLDADNKQMTITTTWPWQGENFTHSIVATRGR